MSIDHNRIKVADLEKNQPNKILTTNTDGELEFREIYNALDCLEEGKVLDARQGKVLKDLVDNVNALLTSDNINLNTIQELVDAIEIVQNSLNTILVNDLSTGGITKALTAEMGKLLEDTKVDKVAGERLINAAEITKLGNQSGVNTGDETAATIKTKLGISTLWGNNTGDQVIPTTLPASDVYAWAKEPIKPTYTNTEVGLGNVDNTSDVNKPVSTATQTALNTKEDKSNKNIANGYAGLGSDGKLISSQLPSITISNTFVVASQAAMLALAVETGDVAVRTDLNKSFILKGTSSSVLTDWQELLTPTDSVSTVFGRNGSVTAQTGDYTADQITETATRKFQTANQQTFNDATSSIQTQLNSKQSNLSGTGLVKSVAGTISYLTDNSSNWNTAYSWGNHAGLYAPTNNPTFTGTLTSGPIISSGKIVWGTASSSAGSVANSLTSGTVLTGKTGEATDFVLKNGLGIDVFRNPTGTSDIETDGSILANVDSVIAIQGISDTNTGVRGTSTYGVGVEGYSTGGIGIIGESDSDTGVQGNSTSGIGVAGSGSIGVSGYSTLLGGYAIIGQAYNGGIGVYGYANTGIAGRFNIATGNTSDIIQGNYNGTNKFKVNYLGDVTGNSFIKTGGISSQFLKADGSVDSTVYQPLLANPVTGIGTVFYYPIFTGTSSIGTGSLSNNGSQNVSDTDMLINGVRIGRGGGNLAENTVVGNGALGIATTANYCSAFGLNALANNISGNLNSAYGYNSLLNCNNVTTSGVNSAFGVLSLQALTSGIENTAIGGTSLANIVTTSRNTAIGRDSGRYINDKSTGLTTSDNSIFLGYRTSALGNSQTNQIVIGYDANGLGSNTTVIGNSSTSYGRWYGSLLIGTNSWDGSSGIQLYNSRMSIRNPTLFNLDLWNSTDLQNTASHGDVYNYKGNLFLKTIYADLSSGGYGMTLGKRSLTGLGLDYAADGTNGGYGQALDFNVVGFNYGATSLISTGNHYGNTLASFGYTNVHSDMKQGALYTIDSGGGYSQLYHDYDGQIYSRGGYYGGGSWKKYVYQGIPSLLINTTTNNGKALNINGEIYSNSYLWGDRFVDIKNTSYSVNPSQTSTLYNLDVIGSATFSSIVTASNGTLIGGTGTTRFLPVFTGSGTLENSTIQDNSNIGNGITMTFGLSPSRLYLNKGGPSGLEIRAAATGLQDNGAGDNVNIVSLTGGLTSGTESYGGFKVTTDVNFLSSKLQFYTGSYTGNPTLRATIKSNGNFLLNTETDNGSIFQANGVITATGGNSTNWNSAFSWGNHAGLYPTYSGAGAYGTWGINISGASTYAATSENSTSWNGYGNTLSSGIIDGNDFTSILVHRSNDNKVGRYSANSIKAWLGLGSSAYTNSGDFIQNQNTSAQSANMWINGTGKFGNSVGLWRTGGSEIRSVNSDNSVYEPFAFFGSTYNFNVGAATFSSTVTAPTFIGNLTGNASTATNLSNSQSNWNSVGGGTNVVGMLAWKNYGNQHVIFDASNGTSPSGTSISSINPQVPWQDTFPTLMGWNGSNTYGVRVDSANSSKTLLSKYPYDGGNSISDSVLAYSLSPSIIGETTVSMHQSHGLFGGYATTLTMSGYERYGATQISAEYNASVPQLAIRNYNQTIGGWNNWVRMLHSGNYGSYSTFSGNITSTTTSINAILGGVSSTWGGNSGVYPTLYSSDATRFVMHINPHISYVQNGVNGYTGDMTGSTVRFAGQPGATSYWDIGVGTNSVGTDIFSIGRSGTNFMQFTNNGGAKINYWLDVMSSIYAYGGLSVGTAGSRTGNLANVNSIAIGDSDTGFRQNGDGVLETFANGTLVRTDTSSSSTFYGQINGNGAGLTGYAPNLTSVKTYGVVRNYDTGDINSSFQNMEAGTISWHDANNESNAPTSGNWYNTISMRHSNPGNVYGTQQAYLWGAGSPEMYLRQINNNSFGPWSKVLSSTNYGDYSSFSGAVSGSRLFAGWDSGAAGSVSCSNWFRGAGNTGWYNDTYDGGIWMRNSTYVEVYNGKKFKVENTIEASGSGGFASSTYAVNQRNPIWRFANADGYGLSYFQGTSGNGSDDTIGIHFGTATTASSQFQFNKNGTFNSSNTIFAPNFSGNLRGPNMIYSTVASSSYGDAVQMREVNLGGAQGYNMAYAPRLAFHWSGIVASSLAIEPSGTIVVTNNPGTGYENFKANDVTATNNFIGNQFKANAAVSNGYSFWGADPINYGILMSDSGNSTYGGRIAGESTSDYNMYFTMTNGSNRGFVFRNSYGTPLFAINGDGVRSNVAVTAPAFYQSSDERLKNKIDNQHSETVSDIELMTYTWKDSSKGENTQVGYSAQEVQKHIPNAVSEDAEGMLSVNYIQVLIAKIASLEKRVKTLENGI